ncbi:MAG: hypothetical protein WCE94_14345 [Candidatus Methanoperedens sp.]
MLKNLDIPGEIKQISRNMKIVYLGVEIQKAKDPWERFTGKIIMKQKVDIEEMLHSKGFEDAS